MKWILRGILIVVTLVVVLAVGWPTYLWLSARHAVPEWDGEVSLDGLSGPVTIIRNEYGVPLISAQSETDAYFGLGYAHAQDRLFAMELMRRQGQGRLAELIGPLAVSVDKYTRTLGLYRRAQDDIKGLSSDVMAVTESYAAGVNAWINSGNPLPVEYKVLMFEPEPWVPADSMVWQKIMGLQLSGNWDEELVDALLIEKLGPEKARELWPSQRPTDHTTLKEVAADYNGLRFAELYEGMTEALNPTLASNVWALNGTRTDTGSPILASDPHLGFQAPNLWYVAGVAFPGQSIFGATVPGVPFHLIGQNEHVAWGLTTTHSDTGDLFIEKLSEDGNSYETPDGLAPLETRTEIINARFGEPVSLTVRETRHGPIVSDVLPVERSVPELTAENHAVALAVNVLQPNDTTAEAIYRVARAANIQEFHEALRLYKAPQQNIVFADDSGGIGYMSPARVPIRKNGDGTVPVPGWTGEFDWMGWIPFEELPQSLNPESGQLVNANNKIVPDDYPHLIAARWRAPYRANRIADLIAANDTATLDNVAQTQIDQVSLMARDLKPLLMELMPPDKIENDPLLSAMLRWNGEMDRARMEPLIFLLWMEKAKTALAADELDETFQYFSGVNAEFIRTILTENQHWCDDVLTETFETCSTQIGNAWDEVAAWVEQQNATDPTSLKWGDYHFATFNHLLFGNLPLVSGIGRMRVSNGGDNYTINVGSHAASTSRLPFRQGHGPAFRAVFDLGDRSLSRFAMAGGQSGHLASPHYDDLLISWRDGRYFAAPTPETAVNRLILSPAK